MTSLVLRFGCFRSTKGVRPRDVPGSANFAERGGEFGRSGGDLRRDYASLSANVSGLAERLGPQVSVKEASWMSGARKARLTASGWSTCWP